MRLLGGFSTFSFFVKCFGLLFKKADEDIIENVEVVQKAECSVR